MITCEFCGTQAEQHDHWRHEIMARVAALEDVVTREPEPRAEAPKRCQHGVPSHLGCWNCTSHAVKVGDVVMDEPPAEQPKAVHLKGCGATLSVRQPRGMCGWIFADGSQSLCAKCKGTDVPAEQPSRQETGGDCGVPGCHACTAMRDRAKAKAAEQEPAKMPTCATCGGANVAAGRDTPWRCVSCESTSIDGHTWSKPAEPSETGQLPSATRCDSATTRGDERCTSVATVRDPIGRVFCEHHRLGSDEPLVEPPAPAAGALRDTGLTADTMPKEVLARLYERATDTLIEARQLRRDQVAALEARLAQAEQRETWWSNEATQWAADRDEQVLKLAQAERERDERGRQVEKMADHVATMRVELDEASRVREDKALRERDEMATSREWWMERYNEAAKERNEATARERERCAGGCEAMVIGGRAWNHDQQVAAETLIAAAKWVRLGAPAPKCDPDPPRDSHWDRPFMVEVCPHGCSEPSDCDICTPELLDHPRAEVVSEGPPTRSLADILRDPPKLNLSPPRDVAPDRTQAEDCARCPVCRWPLAETVDKGCVPGNCSYRPRERGNP